MSKELEIDRYEGGRHVLLILTGLGGDNKGYDNKYAQIAENARIKHNASVFVATTPQDAWFCPKGHIDKIMRYIYECMRERGISDYDIYAMGHSAGGTFMLWYAHEYPDVKRVMATNPVFNVNLHRMQEGLAAFKGERLAVIVGEKDPRAPYAQLVESVPGLRLITIANADHHFTGLLDEFIALPEKYLY